MEKGTRQPPPERNPESHAFVKQPSSRERTCQKTARNLLIAAPKAKHRTEEETPERQGSQALRSPKNKSLVLKYFFKRERRMTGKSVPLSLQTHSPEKVKPIMDYYSAVCDQEQEQCEIQGDYGQGYSDCEAQANISRGPGLLCACGMMQSQDCNCPI